MKNEIVEKFIEIIGRDYCLTEISQTAGYLYDETEQFVRPAARDGCVVLKPGGAEEISEIVKYANEARVPVYARGGGTGLSGGAIPTETGAVISLERLNRVIEIDDKNLMAVVEAGVTLGSLLEELDKRSDLFFPIHPGDEGAQIGGMAAVNAGGARAIKHGVMRSQIKGLEVVLPTGEIVSMGGKLIKNNAGYDLTHLMIGSEGTLGIITKVILRLYGKAGKTMTLVVSFGSAEDAADSVPPILQSGLVPLAIEYIERETAEHSARHMGLTWPAAAGRADLMFVLDGDGEDDLYAKCEKIIEICERRNAAGNIIAESAKEQSDLLAIRSNVYTAYKEDFADTVDVAVPPASVPEMIKELSRIAGKYGTRTPVCGHIGDGNIHNFILRENGAKPPYFDEMLKEMYEAGIRLGGTITAEHGTGKTKRKYMRLQFSERELEIMKAIKKAFDPNNILNPGCVF